MIMKKYLFLVALCLSPLVHSNTVFDRLRQLHDNVHVNIYQAQQDFDAPQPAPEVPYIAGLLGNQNKPVAGEARYIYDSLYNMRTAAGGGRVPSGLDVAKREAFDALQFDFSHFNQYRSLGHSVLGVAAQEVALPASSSATSLNSRGAMAAGDVSSAEVKSKINQIQASILLLDKTKKARTIKEMETDIAILTELESELNSGVRIVDNEGEIFDRLNEFYNYLQSDDLNVAMKLGTLRKQLKSAIDSPTSAASSQPSGPVAVTLSPLERVRAKLSKLRSSSPTPRKVDETNADIAILSELEDELLATGKRDEEQQERFDDLNNFFKILEDGNANIAAGAGGLRRRLKESALENFPPFFDSSAPVRAAGWATVQQRAQVNSATVFPIALPSGQDVQDVINRVQAQQIAFDYQQKIGGLKAELAMKELEQHTLEKEIAKVSGQISQATRDRRLDLTRNVSSLKTGIEIQQKNQKNGLLDIKLLNEFLDMIISPSEQTVNAARFKDLTEFFRLKQKSNLTPAEGVRLLRLRNALEPQIPTAAAAPVNLLAQLKARGAGENS
jgi:hypothetical protein